MDDACFYDAVLQPVLHCNLWFVLLMDVDQIEQMGKNPSIPMKFSLGILQLGAGFLVTLVGLMFVNDAYQVPLLTLVFLYMLHYW